MDVDHTATMRSIPFVPVPGDMSVIQPRTDFHLKGGHSPVKAGMDTKVCC